MTHAFEEANVRAFGLRVRNDLLPHNARTIQRKMTMIRRAFWIAAAALALATTQGSLCRAAGDVTVKLMDGTISILGDGEDNVVTITGDADTFTLTIDGDLTASCSLEGVISVVINTGGGNDTISVSGSIPGNLLVSGGAGQDWVYLTSSTVLGDLFLEGGLDADAILVWSLALAGSLDISTGHGADLIRFLSSSEIGGSIQINTGVNSDSVEIFGAVSVAGDLLVNFGQGDDVLNIWALATPQVTVTGHAMFHGDQGADQIYGVYPFALEDLIAAAGGLEVVGFE